LEHVEQELVPLADEGGKAMFMSVPVASLSREALLGLVCYLGRQTLRDEASREQERAMWKDIARSSCRRLG
jgi:hypothetical protein